MPLVFAGGHSNGMVLGREDAEVGGFHRTAASSALRRLVMAAAACDGAAGAAATAADEIAQLRADVARATSREELRSRSAPYLGFAASQSSHRDRDRERAADVAAAGQAAQARAEAALQAHRKARLALRRQAEGGNVYLQDTDNAKEVASKEAANDSSRREAAAAIAAATEARAEMAALRDELAAESQAKRRLSEEAEGFNQRIRRAQAEAVLARDELAGTRASEASTVALLREELYGSRSKAAAEAHEAEEAVKALRQVDGAVAEARASAEAAWAAKAAEAATAAAFQQSLQAAASEVAAAQAKAADEQAKTSARIRQLEHDEEAAAAAFSRDALKGRVSEMMLARREEAARKIISSLMASKLESLVLGVFSAWRGSKALTHRELAAAAAAEEEAQELAQLRRQNDVMHEELSAAAACPNCGNIYLADAVFCRHCGVKRPQQADSEALAEESKEVSKLRRQIESLSTEAASAADASAARELAAQAAAEEAREAAKLRRHVEALKSEAASAAADAAKAAEGDATEMASLRRQIDSLNGEVASAADISVAKELALKEAEDEAREAAKLRRQIDSLNSEITSAADTSAAKEEAVKAAEDEAAQLRRQIEALKGEVSSAADTSAAKEQAVKAAEDEAAQLRRQIESLSSEVASTADTSSANEEAVKAAEDEAAQLRRQIESLSSAAASAADTSAAKEQALKAAEDEAAQLRRQIESLHSEVASAADKSAAKELAAKAAEDEAREAAQLRRQVDSLKEEISSSAEKATDDSSLLQELLVVRTVAAALSCREEASQKMIAKLLASERELYVKGVFLAWREAGKAADEASQVSTQCAKCGNIYAADALFCRKCGTQRPNAPEELENKRMEVESLKSSLSAEKESVSSEAALAASLRSQLASAEEQAQQAAKEAASVEERAEKTSWSLRCTAAMLSRRETASRQVLATLIAARVELLVLGAFSAWREVLQARSKVLLQGAFGAWRALGASSKEAELEALQRNLAASQGQLAQETAELEKLRREVSDKSSAEVAVAAEQRAAQEALGKSEAEAAKASSGLQAATAERKKMEEDLASAVAEAAALRKELEESLAQASASAAEVAGLQQGNATLELQATELRQQLDDTQSKPPNEQDGLEAARLQGELEEVRAEAALSQVVSTMLARRAEVSQSMLMSFIATELERFVRGAFYSWRDALGGDVAEAASSSCARPSNLPEVLHATLLTRQAEVCRSVLSRCIAQQMEALVRGVFISWRSAQAPANDANGLAEEAALRQLYARRESATRCAYASLLASQLELVVAGAFQAWRSAITLRPGEDGNRETPSDLPASSQDLPANSAAEDESAPRDLWNSVAAEIKQGTLAEDFDIARAQALETPSSQLAADSKVTEASKLLSSIPIRKEDESAPRDLWNSVAAEIEQRTLAEAVDAEATHPISRQSSAGARSANHWDAYHMNDVDSEPEF
eukprot:TRINITY_DN1393_c0_g3_i1.p1 TRINITY_DN1393_c0_g3~~TRINITY_DN1393_c0_g3_i1.p1  ORF type:complete len:1455 (-),score=500.23 TRINITY_DN1393_c0_g3_i1:33-4397(-)